MVDGAAIEEGYAFGRLRDGGRPCDARWCQTAWFAWRVSQRPGVSVQLNPFYGQSTRTGSSSGISASSDRRRGSASGRLDSNAIAA